MPSRTLHIFSDFDSTMIPVNSAARLVRHYLVMNPHHEPFYTRLRRAMPLAVAKLRRQHFERYYELLRRIPWKTRHHLIAAIHPSEKWYRLIKELRLKHKSEHVRVTIVSRNCVDVVHDWVMQNRGDLRKHRVVVEGIIANGPLHDAEMALVRERADLKHIDYVGFGQMLEREKKQFLDADSIYVGDADDEMLRSLVKEFIRV